MEHLSLESWLAPCPSKSPINQFFLHNKSRASLVVCTDTYVTKKAVVFNKRNKFDDYKRNKVQWLLICSVSSNPFYIITLSKPPHFVLKNPKTCFPRVYILLSCDWFHCNLKNLSLRFRKLMITLFLKTSTTIDTLDHYLFI